MSKTRYRGICAPTGKRIYTDQLDVLLDHQRNPRKIRAYQCPHRIHGEAHWHATSQPERKQAA